jgi:hexosaminidase
MGKEMKPVLLSAVCISMSAMAGSSIIPQPVELKALGGKWELTAETAILYSGNVAKQPAEILAKQLRPATGFKLPVKRKAFRHSAEGNIVFQILEDPALGTEGYSLCVTDHVSINAPEPDGLFYGAQTLRQLLPPEIYSSKVIDAEWESPAVEIRDVPQFGWRGLHLDVARHFMPKENVLKFIDTMASLKFNTFHWHLTDDQGWRIEIRNYAKLTEVGAWRKETIAGHMRDTPRKYDGKPHGGFYTQDEIREVVAYAAERHITIVPEIDMPGHMQAAIAAYPELGCTTNQLDVKTEWGICTNILNPEESTVQFCKDVLSEIMELFPSEFIHIGGDEAKKDQWEASDRIQQLREERGLKDMHEMQSWFIKQIDDFLAASGRRLIGWDEIAEGGLAENAAVMWWRGKAGQTHGLEIAKKAAQEGHDIVVAANGSLYFDYYQSKDKKSEPLAIGGFLPLEEVYAFEPVIVGLDAQTASHILGAQGQLWTEYMLNMKHVEYMAFPRACALAELVWLPQEQKNYESFLNRMNVQEKRFDAAGVNYREIK